MSKCPNCGAPRKYPAKTAHNGTSPRIYPTTYVCGTVNSQNWLQPVVTKQCSEFSKGAVK